MPENAISILRVSTKRQLNDGDGIENQRRGNSEYVRRKGYRLIREFVIAESADHDEREDFEAAIREAMRKELGVTVLVFWKVDRISRGGVLPYYTLKGVLATLGIPPSGTPPQHRWAEAPASEPVPPARLVRRCRVRHTGRGVLMTATARRTDQDRGSVHGAA